MTTATLRAGMAMPLRSANAVATHLRARQPRHLVGGALVSSPNSFAVINPATAQPFADCYDATREQLDEAVDAARRAQRGWAAEPPQARRAKLARMGQVMEAHVDELAAIVTIEQGKPLARARDEVLRTVGLVNALTSIPLGSHLLRDGSEGRVELHYRPLGVVGAITPWNMPIVLSVAKVAHALYTGNTIVIKPSPYTPLSAMRFGELVHHIFPPGVINILAGGNELGRWLSEHPGIDKISFTGSGATGKHVMASSAGNLKRLTLELGGNDSAIVLDDVDVASVAPKLFAAAFTNSGQVCMAIKRLYVHDALYEQLTGEIARLARAARVGDGFDPATDLGPVQNNAQFDIVRGILDDTHKCGAEFLAGGTAMDRPGYFIEPTVVANIAEGTRLVDEEPFGPVLPIIRFTDVNDALERANRGSFGLAGSIWSADIDRASALAVQLEAGTAWINRHGGADALVPFGGSRQSGLGREFGAQGLHEYMECKAVFIPAATPTGDKR